MRGFFLRNVVVGCFLAAALTACGKSGNNAIISSAAKSAYSERELAADPMLSLKPGQTAAMFMEPRDAMSTSQADTGPLGTDVIPVTIDREGSYTYYLDGNNITGTVAKAEMFKLPGMEKVFELNAANPSVTVTLAAGSYLIKLHSNYTVADSGGADHRLIFLHSEVNKSGLKMAAERDGGNAKQVLSDACSGCDLGKADLTGANLRNVDLSGASIAGANLTNADITGTNLVGADMTGTIWTTGTTGRAITLVNNCATEIWAAAAGNDAPKTCQSSSDCGGGECDATTNLCKQVFCGTNADCPNNSYCGGVASYDKDKKCLTDANCGKNRFCGSNGLCGWNTCKFVPLPVTDIIQPKKTCSANGDCCTGDKPCKLPFCFTTMSSSGQCANVPAANQGNSWDMTTGYTQTIPVPSPWGGRFWARTGCTTTYSPCGTPPCQDNSDCKNGGTCDTAADPSKSATYCRSDEDCSRATHQKCDIAGIPGFISDSYTCQQDSDCDKYGSNMVCVAYPAGSKKRCGFHQCYWYMCTDPKNCNPQFSCDTGKCLGADGVTFSQNCRASGTDSPTLAELYMPLYYKYDKKGNKLQDTDFYDVSLVDGANIPIQIAPDVNSYKLDPAGKSCSADKDCWDTAHRGGHELACLAGKCVDRYQCGSPGCASAAECDKYGQGNGLVKPSAWGGRSLAIPESDCKEELKLKNGSGTYVGCLTPKDACTSDKISAANKATLQCNDTVTGQNDTYVNLYACNGGIYGVSCYSNNAGGTCCGCPTWSVDQLFCAGTNQQWLTVSDLYYKLFHDASPTSYSFPFDDFNSTFTCKGKNQDVLVNYTVTFCPK